jgi:hypothetical protein
MCSLLLAHCGWRGYYNHELTNISRQIFEFIYTFQFLYYIRAYHRTGQVSGFKTLYLKFEYKTKKTSKLKNPKFGKWEKGKN